MNHLVCSVSFSISTFKATAFLFKDVSGSVQRDPALNVTCLFINGMSGMPHIVFPEPISRLTMNFGANMNNLVAEFCHIRYIVDEWGQAVADDEAIVPVPIAKSQQSPVISYNAHNYGLKAIDKVVLRFDNAPLPHQARDYDGDLVIGGHAELPGTNTASLVPGSGNIELGKALQFVSLYNRSFTGGEVLSKHYQLEAGLVTQWPLDTHADTTDRYPAYQAPASAKYPVFMKPVPKVCLSCTRYSHSPQIPMR